MHKTILKKRKFLGEKEVKKKTKRVGGARLSINLRHQLMAYEEGESSIGGRGKKGQGERGGRESGNHILKQSKKAENILEANEVDKRKKRRSHSKTRNK